MVAAVAVRWLVPVMLGLSGLLALSTGAYAAQCGADPQALKWLDKMSRSSGTVSYHGVVTFQRDGAEMQVVQVAHNVADGTTSDTFTQLTGQGAQVIRKDHPLDCIHPGHQLLRLGGQLQAGQCGLAENYRFSVADTGRVAGRKAVRVHIEPLDVYRFGYQLDLDRQTGLLLRTEILGRGNTVLERFQFADLTLGESRQQREGVDLVHHAAHPMAAPAATGRELSRGWQVNWLPRGFTATEAPGPQVPRRTYTDGLAVFSVFLEELDRELRPGEGVAREGSTTSYTRGMTLDGQPLLVTVVGEVPVNTARMVADSLSWGR